MPYAHEYRPCKQAIDPLAQYDGDQPDVWYFRAAWQEWPAHESDVVGTQESTEPAVPAGLVSVEI